VLTPLASDLSLSMIRGESPRHESSVIETLHQRIVTQTAARSYGTHDRASDGFPGISFLLRISSSLKQLVSNPKI